MSIQDKELIKSIEALPEDLQKKILDYIEYIKFMYINNNSPEDIIIKNEEDLKSKLEEGIKDIKEGKVCSMEEAFDEIDKMLED